MVCKTYIKRFPHYQMLFGLHQELKTNCNMTDFNTEQADLVTDRQLDVFLVRTEISIPSLLWKKASLTTAPLHTLAAGPRVNQLALTRNDTSFGQQGLK